MKPSLYTRPNKPKTITIHQRQSGAKLAPVVIAETVAVSASSECHVTPPEVARRMADYLGESSYAVLEPHAGTGNLVQALLDVGYAKEKIHAVEREFSLTQFLQKRFNDELKLSHQCFFEYAEQGQKYQRIICNPPFKLIRRHMAAALSLLSERDAVMIALVPITFEHADAQTLEVLPRDTFSTAAVCTKIIEFTR